MTRDEAVEQVLHGKIPLESITIDGTGGLKEIAQALGITVSSRPKKSVLITQMKTAAAVIPATPVVPTVPTATATHTHHTPADVAVQAASQREKFPTEATADRILRWMFKGR